MKSCNYRTGVVVVFMSIGIVAFGFNATGQELTEYKLSTSSIEPLPDWQPAFMKGADPAWTSIVASTHQTRELSQERHIDQTQPVSSRSDYTDWTPRHLGPRTTASTDKSNAAETKTIPEYPLLPDNYYGPRGAEALAAAKREEQERRSVLSSQLWVQQPQVVRGAPGLNQVLMHQLRMTEEEYARVNGICEVYSRLPAASSQSYAEALRRRNEVSARANQIRMQLQQLNGGIDSYSLYGIERPSGPGAPNPINRSAE